MLHQRWLGAVAAILLGAGVLVACDRPINEPIPREQVVVTEIVEVIVERPVEVIRVITQTVTVVVTPTPDSFPPKRLTICLIEEPESLYPYAPASPAATAVRHALFENLFTHLTYDYQPTNALVKLPSLADGDAVIAPVEVAAGELVVDASGNVVVLQNGVRLIDADGETVQFSGAPVSVAQMTAVFTLNEMRYSDGVLVTADDSVYSFELNVDPDTPADKFKVARTASYRALDDLTLEWVGLPGFLDPAYFTNVWTPLPRHVWGPLTAVELLEADVSSRAPLGHGPFVVSAWLPGERIELVRNDFYYQPDYPKLDSVTFQFVPNANQLIARLLFGQCDVGLQQDMDMAQAPILIEAEQAGILTPYFQSTRSYEHIDLNIDPLDGRTRWFEDVRARQAFAHCLDRAAIAEAVLYGRAEILHAYISAAHPLYPADLTEWPYDPEAGAALLEEAGFLLGEDGLRRHPETDEPFQVSLGANSGNDLRARVGGLFQENLRECGVEVTLYHQPAAQWFADGPEGDLFGRRYDLAAFAWLMAAQPGCHLFAGDNVPGPPSDLDEVGAPLHPAGWRGDNNSGWRNDAFTAACRAAQNSLPGTAVYQDNHQQALRIFAEELPIIPLFPRLKLAAARPDLLNFNLDPTEESELYNIWQFDLSN